MRGVGGLAAVLAALLLVGSSSSRAAPGEHAAIGELTVAAYAAFTRGAEDFYVAHLRDAAAREADTEVSVSRPDTVLTATRPEPSA